MAAVNGYPWDGKAESVEKLRKECEAAWGRIESSREWTVLLAVARQMEVAAPSRPTYFMNLPDELGGPRDIDRSQLKFLSSWLTAAVWVHFPSAPRENKEEYDRQFGPLNEFLGKRKELIERVVQSIDDKLKAAEK